MAILKITLLLFLSYFLLLNTFTISSWNLGVLKFIFMCPFLLTLRTVNPVFKIMFLFRLLSLEKHTIIKIISYFSFGKEILNIGIMNGEKVLEIKLLFYKVTF